MTIDCCAYGQVYAGLKGIFVLFNGAYNICFAFKEPCVQGFVNNLSTHSLQTRLIQSSIMITMNSPTD